MSVAFKDYYGILGVGKTATAEEIKKAFRKLARTCHPDLAKDADKASSEARFKEINEAYEVLKDPEKRAKYDQLGADWNRYGAATGQADGEAFYGDAGGRGYGYEYHFGGTGFSDFFERFFGGMGADPFGEADLGRGFGSASRGPSRVRGRDVEAEIMVTLEEALRGATRRISLNKRDAESGRESVDTLNVTIPAGVREGQRIRLAGQGQPSPSGGPAGDLFLRARFAQHPHFAARGSDLHYDLKLAPWEAALGARVSVPTLEGGAKVQVKAGTQSGQSLRLRGHGLPKPGGGRGDLLAEVSIKVPRSLSERERELWRQLQSASSFDARSRT